MIGNDDHVGLAVGIDLPGGRHERPQHRDQLYRAHVLDRDDLRDDLIGGRTDMVLQVVIARIEALVGIRNDLHRVAGARHGDEVMHLKNRLEGLVEGRGIDGRRGNHGHLRAHARIDDESLVGGHGDRIGDLSDVRIPEVQGVAGFIGLALARRSIPGCRSALG